MQALAEARMPDNAEQREDDKLFTNRFKHWLLAAYWIEEVVHCDLRDAIFRLGDAISCGDVRAVDGRGVPILATAIHERLVQEFAHISMRDEPVRSYAQVWRSPELVTYVLWEDLLRRWPSKPATAEYRDSATPADLTSAAPVAAERPNTNENLGGEAKPPSSELRRASADKIKEAILAEYDEADVSGRKPPNVKEIVKPVQNRLFDQGLEASGRYIQDLASADVYKNRRRKPGATVFNEQRKRQR
jgi:hypothetical protein